jgi:hypothetical protein
VCQTGTPVYAQLCPANTLFDQSRQACYDQCHDGADSAVESLNGLKPASQYEDLKWNTFNDDFDRRPRQVKFLTGSEYGSAMGVSDNAAGTRDRRQVKFGKLSRFTDEPIHAGVHKLASRQIKFYAIPDRESAAAANWFGFSRQSRQVKFRSLENDYDYGGQDGASDVGKKHMPRQIKFSALHSSVVVPTMSEERIPSQDGW